MFSVLTFVVFSRSDNKIPAVLAVGNATRKIRDGEMVMVDGDTGKVVIV